MADSDSGSYILRYDFNNSSLQYFSGANWYTAVSNSQVATLNGLSGAITLAAGSGITIVPTGQTLTINSSQSAITATLTGYSSTTGTISSADTILSAIEKLNGNQAAYMPLSGGTFTGTFTQPYTATFNKIVMAAPAGNVDANYTFTPGTNAGIWNLYQAFALVTTSFVAETLATGSPLITGTIATIINDASSTSAYSVNGITLQPGQAQMFQYSYDNNWYPLSQSGGGSSPAGSDNQIQYNIGGAFTASSDLTFDPTTDILAVTPSTPLVPTLSLQDGNSLGASIELNSDASSSINFQNAAGSTDYCVISNDTSSNLSIGNSNSHTWTFGGDAGLQLPLLTTLPGSPIDGEIVEFNDTARGIKYFARYSVNDSTWIPLDYSEELTPPISGSNILPGSPAGIGTFYYTAHTTGKTLWAPTAGYPFQKVRFNIDGTQVATVALGTGTPPAGALAFALGTTFPSFTPVSGHSTYFEAVYSIVGSKWAITALVTI